MDLDGFRVYSHRFRWCWAHQPPLAIVFFGCSARLGGAQASALDRRFGWWSAEEPHHWAEQETKRRGPGREHQDVSEPVTWIKNGSHGFLLGIMMYNDRLIDFLYWPLIFVLDIMVIHHRTPLWWETIEFVWCMLNIDLTKAWHQRNTGRSERRATFNGVQRSLQFPCRPW